ncbi:MAG: hypothetical protein NTY06_04665, partial [Candidatus Gottesmanbacteria bacterium]|nr:hypothetical protein [Candidatus Gottesmanbacteria bacterium]
MTTPDQFKKQIGIGQQTIETGVLTPTTQSIAAHIKMGDIITELLRENRSPAQEITPELTAFADLCLQHYNGIHDRIRKGYLSISDSAYKDYGLHTQVVGDVILSPVNAKGRWFMNFRTTHLMAEHDTNTDVNCFAFDTNSANLDKPS